MADMRLHVKQFRYATDNLGYLIYGKTSALAVDGGAVEAMLEYINARGLQLDIVTQTHSHPDHICGHQQLIDHTGAAHLNAQSLRRIRELVLDGHKIRVYHTPGHTEDSVIFHTADTLLTGDTLFNGNVGSCFSGGMQRFFESIKLIMGFSDHTRIYAGHDYVNYSMQVAKLIEPSNSEIDRFRENYDPHCVCSSLEQEHKINPFLRFNDPAMIAILKARALPHVTEYERWTSVMSLP